MGKHIKVEAGDNTVSIEGNREYLPWRDWMYVPEAVELRDALDKAIGEATRKGRERAQESERAARIAPGEFGAEAIGQRVIENMGVTESSFNVVGNMHDYLVRVSRACCR